MGERPDQATWLQPRATRRIPAPRAVVKYLTAHRLTLPSAPVACSPSNRDVGQPDHILVHQIVRRQMERRAWSGEVRLALAEHDRMQVDPILVDEAKLAEAVRQSRA